jgi:hypothetical protein
MSDDHCRLVWYDTLGHQCRRRGDHSRHECVCGAFWQDSATLPVFGPPSDIERVSQLIGPGTGDVYSWMSDREHLDAPDAERDTGSRDPVRCHPRSNQVQLPAEATQGYARFIPPSARSLRGRRTG